MGRTGVLLVIGLFCLEFCCYPAVNSSLEKLRSLSSDRSKIRVSGTRQKIPSQTGVSKEKVRNKISSVKQSLTKKAGSAEPAASFTRNSDNHGLSAQKYIVTNIDLSADEDDPGTGSDEQDVAEAANMKKYTGVVKVSRTAGSGGSGSMMSGPPYYLHTDEGSYILENPTGYYDDPTISAIAQFMDKEVTITAEEKSISPYSGYSGILHNYQELECAQPVTEVTGRVIFAIAGGLEQFTSGEPGEEVITIPEDASFMLSINTDKGQIMIDVPDVTDEKVEQFAALHNNLVSIDVVTEEGKLPDNYHINLNDIFNITPLEEPAYPVQELTGVVEVHNFAGGGGSGSMMSSPPMYLFTDDGAYVLNVPAEILQETGPLDGKKITLQATVNPITPLSGWDGILNNVSDVRVVVAPDFTMFAYDETELPEQGFARGDAITFSNGLRFTALEFIDLEEDGKIPPGRWFLEEVNGYIWQSGITGELRLIQHYFDEENRPQYPLGWGPAYVVLQDDYTFLRNDGVRFVKKDKGPLFWKTHYDKGDHLYLLGRTLICQEDFDLNEQDNIPEGIRFGDFFYDITWISRGDGTFDKIYN